MNLNASKLIEVGEDIINDEQLGFVAQITVPIQEFECESLVRDGETVKYQLQLIITSENILLSSEQTKLK